VKGSGTKGAPARRRLLDGNRIGPQLDAIADRRGLARLKAEVDHGVLAPIYETIKRVKEDLPRDVALLSRTMMMIRSVVVSMLPPDEGAN
jgi:hypothetical protein